MALFEIVLEGRQGTDDMLSVLHYDLTGSTPYNWTAMANIFRLNLNDHMRAMCGSWVTWLGITVRPDVSGSVGLFVPFELGLIAGSQVDPESITQVAMQVNKNTGALTRPTRGRVFQGGLSVRRSTPTGTWEVSTRNEVVAFWEAVRVIDFQGPSTASMVVKASNPAAPNTVPFNFVTSVGTSGIPVVQRRRKLGQGS